MDRKKKKNFVDIKSYSKPWHVGSIRSSDITATSSDGSGNVPAAPLPSTSTRRQRPSAKREYKGNNSDAKIARARPFLPGENKKEVSKNEAQKKQTLGNPA